MTLSCDVSYLRGANAPRDGYTVLAGVAVSLTATFGVNYGHLSFINLVKLVTTEVVERFSCKCYMLASSICLTSAVVRSFL